MRALLRKHDAFITLFMVLAAVLFGLLVCGVLIAAIGINPFRAYAVFVKGIFGTRYGFGEMVNKFTPLLCTALGFSIAQRTGFFNVDGEGQVAVGALVSLLVAQHTGGMPAPAAILLPILCGMAAGAAACALCGALKIWFGAEELLTLLMLNYIIKFFIQWLLAGPIKNPNGMMEQSAPIPDVAKLPSILPESRLHLGVVIALLALFAIWYLQWHTVAGYEMRLSGANPTCARYVGVKEKRALMTVILISGAMAGLSGAMELQGNQYRLMSDISNNFGFDGIGIAILGRHKPAGIFFAAIVFAMIRIGTASMQRGCEVPVPMINIMQGIIVVAVLISYFFGDKLRLALLKGEAAR